MRLRWIVPLAVCLAPGCASAGAEKTVAGPLAFPLSMAKSSVILHEVNLFFEVDRMARQDEEPEVARGRQGENYVAGYADEPDQAHHFSYDLGKFKVGDFYYPAQRNGLLFMLQERAGPLSFTFRDVNITVEQKSRWKPAVMYYAVEEKKELDPEQRGRKRQTKRVVTRVIREEIQAGPYHLTSFPNTRQFEINAQSFTVPEGGTISIDRRGRVKISG